MTEDLDKIIIRLISISTEFTNEIDELAKLSYYDREETKTYDEHFEHLKSLFNSEAVIVNNLNLVTLKEIYNLLPRYDDATDAFYRTCVYIEDRLEELIYNEENEKCLEELVDQIKTNENLELDDDEISQVEKYLLEDEDNERYEVAFIDYISIETLKRIRERINNTSTDNKIDYKFKKCLLKNLKTFKYFVFAENRNLEKLGINCHFNVTKIPYLSPPDIDTGIISYNRCLLLLSKLYNPSDDNVFQTTFNLFNMMSFESYLKNVGNENLEQLLMACDELTLKSKNPYYGNIAKAKILSKSKN